MPNLHPTHLSILVPNPTAKTPWTLIPPHHGFPLLIEHDWPLMPLWTPTAYQLSFLIRHNTTCSNEYGQILGESLEIDQSPIVHESFLSGPGQITWPWSHNSSSTEHQSRSFSEIHLFLLRSFDDHNTMNSSRLGQSTWPTSVVHVSSRTHFNSSLWFISSLPSRNQ